MAEKGYFVEGLEGAETDLSAAGSGSVVSDRGVSGVPALSRPAFGALWSGLEAGDVLIVPSLLHLGADLAEVSGLLRSLDGRKVGFRSLSENVFSAAARAVKISKAMQKSTKKIGRPKRMDSAHIAEARAMLESGKEYGEVAAAFGVSVSTIYHHLPTFGVMVEKAKRETAERIAKTSPKK